MLFGEKKELVDGQESDITNEYGRFAVVYDPYSGEYVKVICQNEPANLSIKMTAVSAGLVDYQSSQSDRPSIQSFDKLLVEEGNVIEVTDHTYEIDTDADGKPDQSGMLVEKNTDEYVPIESAAFPIEELQLALGEAKTVGITLSPENATNTAVEWVSQNKEIATVKNGVVTALAPGETTILAKVCDASEMQLELPVAVKDGMGDLLGHSLSMTGNIGVNFYMALSDDVLNDEGASMHFTLPNGSTAAVPIKDAEQRTIDGKLCHVFTCEITSTQMTGEIKAQLVRSDNTSGRVYTYSAKEYADVILSGQEGNEAYAKAAPLVKAMLNYGGYAQQYFKYDDTLLANADLSEEERSLACVTPELLSSYQSVKAGTEQGIHYYGSSLILKSETTIRHYFTLEDGYEIGNFHFMMNDTELEPTAFGKYYYVDIPNVASGDLDTDYEVRVGGFCLTYNAMCYVKDMLEKESTEQSLGSLLKAAYLYSQAANAYFNK